MLAKTNKPINILLADDDIDDRFFFNKALNELPITTKLTMVEDGEKLMQYLLNNSSRLPDVLFLDLNMPRRNGLECLGDIKAHEKLKALPVIIYSTSLYEEVANLLYINGAYYYVKKTVFGELTKILHFLLLRMQEGEFKRPPRTEFVMRLPQEQE